MRHACVSELWAMLKDLSLCVARLSRGHCTREAVSRCTDRYISVLFIRPAIRVGLMIRTLDHRSRISKRQLSVPKLRCLLHHGISDFLRLTYSVSGETNAAWYAHARA